MISPILVRSQSSSSTKRAFCSLSSRLDTFITVAARNLLSHKEALVSDTSFDRDKYFSLALPRKRRKYVPLFNEKLHLGKKNGNSPNNRFTVRWNM